MWSKKTILLAGLLLVLGSCRTRKEAPSPEAGDLELSEIVSRMKEAEVSFTGMNARFSAQYTSIDNKRISMGGFLRINDDSAIWLSLSPMAGLEAARAMITHDSVKMVNRLNATYFLGGIDYINAMLQTDVDYDILQALILGNDIPYYEDDVFRQGLSGRYHHITTQGRRKLKKHVRNDKELERVLIQDIFIDPENYRIRRHEIKQVGQEQRKLVATYDDFREVEGQWFPFSIRFEISVEGNIELDISMSRISTGDAQKMPFGIPASYQRVE